MSTYISLLRGINVSGQKKILMANLKVLYEQLNFKNVQTYIQSGNVVFDFDEKNSNQEIAQLIEDAITEHYGFNVPILIRNSVELQNTINKNPFVMEAESNPAQVLVTLLSASPKEDNLRKLVGVNFPPDRFAIHDLDIYIHCPQGYGNSKLSNNFFETKLKIQATTRNWKTINKLLEMADCIK